MIEPPRDALRSATRDAHAMVDEAFGRFDLAEDASYRAFLTAHARIVPSVEAWLDAHQPVDMQPWTLVRRWPALSADLAELGIEPPTPVPFALSGDIASVCGVTYVLEGSRMGGALLSRRVASGLPAAYLGAPSQVALWRGFFASLDEHLPTQEAIDRACDAALRTFDAFHAAGVPATNA
ncbi:biliverdin-producing heme oxygenase [Sphingobium sufflavum]|uniref:biliverdin-producing heme oxygenase n=1 Tax=Sphingobium sufflavum TaxID=1129547 RepID=UPI001F40E846|nr:biliverdin-producing heme oxygenase [Sphingobium sufflavum]MCE7797328.1 biliverdin-producing heme oxygenase [Sphingobium sufflavum]